jgi:imidazolonepropionase-like amidohydrolase
LVREKLEKGRDLMTRQNDWCTISEIMAEKLLDDIDWTEQEIELNPILKGLSEKKKGRGNHPNRDHKSSYTLSGRILHPHGHYPESIQLEPVVALLRGQVRVNWHCYQVNDIEIQLRIAREFNISIAAFHHALDIYQVTAALHKWKKEGRHPIGAAIFSDHWGYKKEAYGASVYAPQVLEKAKIPFAFKSDHPVLHSQFLVHESAKAIQYGLSEQSTLRALTSVPAKLMGVDYRIGSIRKNMDADIVIWQSNPFAIGSLPEKVIVDGAIAFEENPLSKYPRGPILPEPNTPLIARVPIQPREKNLNVHLQNIGKIIAGNQEVLNQEMMITKSQIICLGQKCESHSENVQVIDLKGATVTLPLTLAGSILGLSEIAQEPGTQDGESQGGPENSFIFARDGLQAGGLMERSTANQGIGLAISVPGFKGASTFGVSTLFATNFTTPEILEPVVAVHKHIGNSVKESNSITGSISGQIANLRHLLLKSSKILTSEGAKADVTMGDNILDQVKQGEIPLVLHVDSANDMSALLQLKDQVDSQRKQRWIFSGAAEVHLILDALQNHNNTVSILLSPARCIPMQWQTRRCLLPPQTDEYGAMHVAHSLRALGIPFALATHPIEMAMARSLRFEAGWVRRLGNLSTLHALKSITTDVLEMFLPKASRYSPSLILDQPIKLLQLGGAPRFSVWNGNPLELTTQLLFSVDASSDQLINYPVHK